jgi:hypothetical protein
VAVLAHFELTGFFIAVVSGERARQARPDIFLRRGPIGARPGCVVLRTRTRA